MKKVLLLLAVLAMLFVVAACRGGGNDPAPTAPPAPTATPPVANNNDTGTTPDTPVLPDVEHGFLHPAVDLGGRVIRMAVWWEHDGITGAANPEPPDPETDNDYELNILRWENARRVERLFNVRFEAVNTVDYVAHNDSFQMHHLAGDYFAEVVMLNGQHMAAAVNGGMVRDLSTLSMPGVNFDLHNNQTYIRPWVQIGSSIWQFGNTETQVDGWSLGVNLDLIRSLGLQNPVDLLNAGQWNWDNFRQILSSATNPHAGTFGISGWSSMITEGLLASNEAPSVTADNNFGLGEPAAIAALEFNEEIFANRWYYYYTGDSGNHPVSWNWDWGRAVNSYHDGVSVFFPHQTWQIQNNHPAFEYAIVNWPPGPNNRNGYSWSGGMPQSWFIPYHVPNPEEILMIIEELYAWMGDETWMLHEAGAA
jgi:hypothetical protein